MDEELEELLNILEGHNDKTFRVWKGLGEETLVKFAGKIF